MAVKLKKAENPPASARVSGEALPATKKAVAKWARHGKPGKPGAHRFPTGRLRSGSGKRAQTAPPLPEVARYLKEVLGQPLTAVVGGAADPKTVGRWATGKARPGTVREWRLRSAYDAARLIAQATGPDTARAWFMGSSPFLDFQPAAVMLGKAKTLDECARVVPAAISFLEGSY